MSPALTTAGVTAGRNAANSRGAKNTSIARYGLSPLVAGARGRCPGSARPARTARTANSKAAPATSATAATSEPVAAPLSSSRDPAATTPSTPLKVPAQTRRAWPARRAAPCRCVRATARGGKATSAISAWRACSRKAPVAVKTVSRTTSSRGVSATTAAAPATATAHTAAKRFRRVNDDRSSRNTSVSCWMRSCGSATSDTTPSAMA